MALRKLVEGDCGGVNPLLQMSTQFTRDVAYKDEGLVNTQYEQSRQQDERMKNEFLGQVNTLPSSFRMDSLLQEMREIESINMGSLQAAPKVLDHVIDNTPITSHVQPQHTSTGNEFFKEIAPMQHPMYQPLMPHLINFQRPLPTFINMSSNTADISGEQFFAEAAAATNVEQMSTEESIFSDSANATYNEEAASNYNEKFWERLQEEWSKLSEDTAHPWLSELDEDYDPYKDYEYIQNNPMLKLSNAYEQGEEYIKRGDIPSAVLCFEAATQQQPDNARAWEMLGLAQSENEMDPQAIAALKHALEIEANNRKVLMALAVCYTNENLQNHALKMLVRWLDAHPSYKHIVDQASDWRDPSDSMYSSLATNTRLLLMQEVFQKAANLNVQQVDAEVQEALGVLYNLSADFEKAAECFRVALSVDSENAKTWNRLGASLANGSRSAEAVQAYQKALSLEPGFIRVRYNVGVCCMNLKAYTQAAEHLLTALNMQANAYDSGEFNINEGVNTIETNQNRMSNTIWSTLKMVLSLLGRNELHGFANERNLTALTQAFNMQ